MCFFHCDNRSRIPWATTTADQKTSSAKRVKYSLRPLIPFSTCVSRTSLPATVSQTTTTLAPIQLSTIEQPLILTRQTASQTPPAQSNSTSTLAPTPATGTASSPRKSSSPSRQTSAASRRWSPISLPRWSTCVRVSSVCAIPMRALMSV